MVKLATHWAFFLGSLLITLEWISTPALSVPPALEGFMAGERFSLGPVENSVSSAGGRQEPLALGRPVGWACESFSPHLSVFPYVFPLPQAHSRYSASFKKLIISEVVVDGAGWSMGHHGKQSLY